MFRNRILAFIIITTTIVLAQHRGNNIAFQGLDNFTARSAKASAMGGAFTSQSGSLDALFYNPAGLSHIYKIQVSATGNYSNTKWFENQVYRPNRYFVTLPFYLEGLYVPDPAQNGMLDSERLWTEDYFIDSSYVVNAPELGVDPQSEDAADWVEEEDDAALANIAVAVPFVLFEKDFTAAVAYGRDVTIADYDRNQTYLDPHIGFLGYGDIGRVNGTDTLNVNWYDYSRKRTGHIDNVNAALSFQLDDNFSFGIGGKFAWGQSDDYYKLDKIGYFTLIEQNEFRFSYDTLYQHYSGTSDYSSVAFNLGAQYKSEHFSIGVKVDLPYTLTREYDYTESVLDTNGNVNTSKRSGEDKIKFPAVLNVGIGFNPFDNLVVAFDYTYAPYSDTEYELTESDSTFHEWVDQQIFRVGVDYRPIDLISLQAGYRQTPQVFVPDGSAVKDAGPKAESINCGFGIHTDYGTLQFAYEYRILRYYDSYYSNTNYNTREYSNFMLGYNLSL